MTLAGRNDLAGIEQPWHTLVQRAANSLPFNQHAFLTAWSETYPDAEPLIMLGWDGDQLEAALPFAIKRSRSLTTLEWMGEPFTEYGDALIAPGLTSMELLKLFEDGSSEAMGITGGYDLLVLRKVRADSAIAPVLTVLGARPSDTRMAPFVPLGNVKDRDSLLAQFGANLRKELRRKRRKIEAAGEYCFAVHRGGMPARRALDAAMAFKSQWLEKRGLTSRAFLDGNAGEFLDRLVPDTPAQDVTKDGILLSEITLDGRTLAVEIGFRNAGRYFAFLGSYDEDMAEWGAGTLQLADTMQWCAENGISEFDLFAPADSYKLRWTQEGVAIADYTQAHTAIGHAMLAYRRNLRPLLKSVYERMPPSMRRSLKLIAENI
ncbi:MAG: GNAT family N-acetyltransferase [Pseudomonadota bacterium]